MVMLANLWKMHGINWTGGSSQRPLQISTRMTQRTSMLLPHLLSKTQQLIMSILQRLSHFFSDAKGALERLQKDLMKLAPLVASDPKHAQSVSFYCIVSNSAHTSSIFCCC
jgi:hypothetical protein